MRQWDGVESSLLPLPLSILNCGEPMTEERKHATLFAATILAVRKLNDAETKPWAREYAITDAIEKANRILEKIDENWPARLLVPR
jgi:hypothetical protein